RADPLHRGTDPPARPRHCHAGAVGVGVACGGVLGSRADPCPRGAAVTGPAGAGRGSGEEAMAVAEEPALSFAGLLRRLRDEARLTQDELAEAAGPAARAVSGPGRGIQRTRPQDTTRPRGGGRGPT